MESGRLTFAAFVAGTLSRWRLAAGVAGGVVLFALALALILPPSYRATASFVTTDAGAGLRGGGVGDLPISPDLMGIASQFGLGGRRDASESPAFYAQLLASRELLTRLLQSPVPDPRTDAPGDSVALVTLMGPSRGDPQRALEKALKRLGRKMQVTYDIRTNFVVLDVDARWPELAAEIANRAAALASAFNKEQRLSRASARRDFLEERVAAAQTELRAQEDSQRLFYERNRSWQNSPALLVEERRMRRQVETTNTLYLSLRQQYETARIDEVNNTPVITVVDRAVPPRRREWPRYGLLLGTTAVLGLGLGLLLAAARELVHDWAQRNPDQATLLRNAFGRFLPRRRRTGDRVPDVRIA